MESMVRCENVVKRYGALTVLDGLDLEVAAGEKVAIIGPSGSGKSTLLNVLATVEGIDGGVIEVDGLPVSHHGSDGNFSAADREHLRNAAGKMGMVFQTPNLFRHLTALENCMEAAVEVKGMPHREAADRAARLLDMVSLPGKRDSYANQLSRWQQQLVAVARALSIRPKVLLIDGVNSALDAALMGDVLDAMRALGEDRGLTMLVVTNQVAFARDRFDRICFLDAGRMVEQGAAAEIFSDPASPRSRAFLAPPPGA